MSRFQFTIVYPQWTTIGGARARKDRRRHKYGVLGQVISSYFRKKWKSPRQLFFFLRHKKSYSWWNLSGGIIVVHGPPEKSNRLRPSCLWEKNAEISHAHFPHKCNFLHFGPRVWSFFDQIHGFYLAKILTLTSEFTIVDPKQTIDQCWWQNHNLHWSLHPKNIFKKFWIAHFWGTPPSQNLTFSCGTPNAFEEGHSNRPGAGLEKGHVHL